MKILFLHQSNPGQFAYLAKILSTRHEVLFLSQHTSRSLKPHDNWLRVRKKETGNESELSRAIFFREKFIELKKEGYDPDVVVSHSGWGCGLYAKDVFPNARLICYSEWWFPQSGHDERALKMIGISQRTVDSNFWRNGTTALELLQSDEIVTPTEWQKTLLPSEFKRRTRVIHDIVDTEIFAPREEAKSLNGDVFTLTYLSRGWERVRCFKEFIKASRYFLDNTERTRVLVGGVNQVFYGGAAPAGYTSWGEFARIELQSHIEARRVTFVGQLDRNRYSRFLGKSNLHCYLTRPFIASWSLLESMSTGCTLMANKVGCTSELIDRRNAYMVNLDKGLGSEMVQAYSYYTEDVKAFEERGRAQRSLIIQRHHRDVVMPEWDSILSAGK